MVVYSLPASSTSYIFLLFSMMIRLREIYLSKSMKPELNRKIVKSHYGYVLPSKPEPNRIDIPRNRLGIRGCLTKKNLSYETNLPSH